MAFLYYNAHPYQLDVDDCVKRAITVTTGMEYMEVQRGLNQHKKLTGAKKFNTDRNPQSYVENVLRFPRVSISKKADGTRITVNEFCKSHPKGRFILSILGHWSAVINGTILDTWDCGDEELYSYYEITPIKRKIPIRYGFIIRREANNKASVSFYDGRGACSVRMILAEHIDGYRACLLDMGKHEAIDWEEERWK